ncbi:enoyl-CoA delta isomerase 1, peroxisomal [Cannabis sativa]|uniref:enoyl-CoA delta isomerase 1, peroxisomal n=1 Tax=Cannabis sativa TaxID=3483 RepID=UPI0029CAA6A7|nr:enoyl-CoA delta isomerase 1, peroxisomal [Cannabis sativa]
MCTLEKKGKIFILTLTGQDEHRLNPTLIDSIHSAIRRVRSEASSSSSSALITTAQGKFFSNGYDLDWVGSSQTRGPLLDSKLKSLIADLISLPLPTIAAVSGHASAAGFILALSHDYVLMRKDRGFLYMSELDIRLPIPTWFVTLIKCKVGAPAARRLVLLTAAKVTATNAVEKGIVDSAHDSAESTVVAAVGLAEKLVERKWDGDVYAQIRMELFSEVLGEIRLSNSASRL